MDFGYYDGFDDLDDIDVLEILMRRQALAKSFQRDQLDQESKNILVGTPIICSRGKVGELQG